MYTYKSSPLTYFYKYLLLPLFGIAFLLVIAIVWSNNNEKLLNEYLGTNTIIILWALVWLTIVMLRLKRVVANYESITVRTLNKQHTVCYNEIEWIYQAVLINPVLILIKYRDKQDEKSKKILLIPELGFGNLYCETEMAKFIRDRITEINPNYINKKEPSRWQPILLLLLTGSLAFLLVMYTKV